MKRSYRTDREREIDLALAKSLMDELNDNEEKEEERGDEKNH